MIKLFLKNIKALLFSRSWPHNCREGLKGGLVGYILSYFIIFVNSQNSQNSAPNFVQIAYCIIPDLCYTIIRSKEREVQRNENLLLNKIQRRN